MRMFNAALYIVTILVWGTSWIAIVYQLGTVSPMVSVAYRFLLAAVLMMAFMVLSGRRLRFSWRHHIAFSDMGLCLFSINYVLVYSGTQHLTSGLVSVAFSSIAMINIVNGALFLKAGINRRVAAGAALGLIGIGVVFLPEFQAFSLAGGGGLGFLLVITGAYVASLGMMISAATQKRKIPVLSTNAWGMTYGAILTGLFAALTGNPFAFDFSPGYIGSLFYLSVFSTVIGFAAYLTLLGRIGPDRAAYTMVVFPILALGLSTWLEGYVWTPPAAIGVVLVLWGNLLVLTRPGALGGLIRRRSLRP